MQSQATQSRRPRLLITAGPTHEPVDAVRYLGNRSSGRLGIAMARAAAARDWPTTLLLGPVSTNAASITSRDTRIDLHRFRTTADLQVLLAKHFPVAEILIMAAAISDYRPITTPDAAAGKLRRRRQNLTLELEPTPDLLAGCAAMRSHGQVIVGFALEPREQLLASAQEKLVRKNLDFIVANPLETMDSAHIEATLLSRDGNSEATDGPIEKHIFAEWLLDIIAAHHDRLRQPATACQAR